MTSKIKDTQRKQTHRHFKVQFIQEIKIINLEGRKFCVGRREGENASMTQPFTRAQSSEGSFMKSSVELKNGRNVCKQEGRGGRSKHIE